MEVEQNPDSEYTTACLAHDQVCAPGAGWDPGWL